MDDEHSWQLLVGLVQGEKNKTAKFNVKAVVQMIFWVVVWISFSPTLHANITKNAINK